MTPMNAFLGVPLGVFDCTPDFWTPDFGQSVHKATGFGFDHGESVAASSVIDIPSCEVTDLSDEIINPVAVFPT